MTIFYELYGNLYLNLTNRCMNACEFCIRDYDEGIDKNTDLWIEREPTLDEIITDLKRFDVKKYPEVVLCGYGEPLIKIDEAIGICKFIKENTDVKIRVNTNGLASWFHNKNVAKELSGLVDIVSISLNHKDKKGYNELCHPDCGEDAFDEILDFTREAKKYIPHIFMTVVDVISPEDIKECQKIAESLGAEFRVREKI